MRTPTGYLLPVLHAHLPFIRHPEHEEFLQENWFFKALDETYYPLLDLFGRLENDGVSYSLTMSLTPTLCEMFVDPFLLERYSDHLDKMEALIASEVVRVRGTELEQTVSVYEDRYSMIRKLGSRWEDPLAGFRHFQDAGSLEIITCPATHPILPFCATDKGRRAHISVAVKNYQKHFGRRPKGIWLAECAYVSGFEQLLSEVGVEYFFMDTHGIMFSTPRPRCGVYAPVSCRNGVAVFGRDVETSREIWSSSTGCLGDHKYREFYRDLGFDADYEHIGPFLQRDGIRRNVGLKYHRITGNVPPHEKEFYDPPAARERAAVHAGDFLFNRQQQVRDISRKLGRPPVITAPYDAELFGHWWFEGLVFLENLFRKIAYDQEDIKTISASKYLELFPECQVVEPASSSWGAGGYFDVWLNDRNDWIYRHLHKAEERMIEMARLHPNASGLLHRALNQAARELMLAQASDWAFIMNAGTAVEYAEKKSRDHVHNFNGIYLQIVEDRLENGWISVLEARNTIFQEMDYRVFL